MKKVIVTGYNGLIGEALVKELTKGPYNIIGIGRGDNSSIQYIDIDFSEDWNVDLLPDDADTIIHLAQSEKFRQFPETALEVFNVNTLSTLKLLDHARRTGVKKFIYASSGGIYGNSEFEVNEESPIVSRKDLGFYLGSKLCSEIVAETYSPVFDVILLRFFFVYGKKQKAGMLMPRLVQSVKNGTPITLDGKDGIKINPVFVDDSAKAIAKAVELTGSHKINIGGSEVLSLREICEIIGEKVNKKPVFNISQNEAKNLIGDIKKMTTLLATPQIKFSSGIEHLI